MDKPEQKIEDMNPEELVIELVKEIKSLKGEINEVFKEGIKQTKEEFEKYLKELSDDILAKKDKQLKLLDKHINRLQELKKQVEEGSIVLTEVNVVTKTAKIG